MTSEYRYTFIDSDDLTSSEIEAMYRMGMRMFPEFAPYYERHRYYSSVKPQMVMNVSQGGILVADGKLLWRDLDVADGGRPVRFFVFGFLVAAEHHGRGIGREMLRRYIDKSVEMDADILYGVTANPIAAHLMTDVGFRHITTTLRFTDALSGQDVEVPSNRDRFGLDLTPGTVARINARPEVHLGVGPL